MKYDVAIIGAGIGGLVCGSYLAKAGLKVIIIEKNKQPGGYCTSFKRKGFVFDAGIHALGGFGEKGILTKIFNELDLDTYINMLHFDITDTIIINDTEVFFRRNFQETIDELKDKFPLNAKEIDNFAHIIFNDDYLFLFSNYHKINFEFLLNKIFTNIKLKNIFSILLGNINLPPSMVSSLTAISLYKRFVMEGGYYPQGGMQSVANGLAKRFIDFGGKLRLNNIVEKINIKNKKVAGIALDGDVIEANYIVSAADCINTFKNLINKQDLSHKFLNSLNNLIISSSNFVVYIGLKQDFKRKLNYKSGIWFTSEDCSQDDLVENLYMEPYKGIVNYKRDHFLISFPSFYDSSLAPKESEVAIILVTAPFLSFDYWRKNKKILEENLVNRVEKMIPGFKERITYIDSASPATLQRYTFNSQGAMNGWASTPTQNNPNLIPQVSEIENLYIAGHWSTGYFGQGGVPMVAYTGRKAAKIILNRKS